MRRRPFPNPGEPPAVRHRPGWRGGCAELAAQLTRQRDPAVENAEAASDAEILLGRTEGPERPSVDLSSALTSWRCCGDGARTDTPSPEQTGSGSQVQVRVYSPPHCRSRSSCC